MSGEFASKGVAGAGLGLGIGGVATGLPALIMSIISLVREGRQHKAEMMAASNGIDMNAINGILNDKAAIATLTSEKYTDAAVLDLYKQQTQAQQALEVQINANFKESFQALAALDKQTAINEVRNECLVKQVDRLAVNVEKLNTEVCDSRVRETQMGAEIRALAADTQSAINLEAERRQCADNATRAWVKATYVPGTLKLSPSSMCPTPVTCGDVLAYYNAGGKPPVPSPCRCGGCGGASVASASTDTE